MSDAQTTPQNQVENGGALTREQILRKVTIFDYALHIASPFTMFLLSVIAVLINYVKRPDSVDTIYHSHMNWMLSTFWWSLLWFIVCGAIGLLTFGLMSWVTAIPLIWYLYRMIKGLIRAVEDRPVA